MLHLAKAFANAGHKVDLLLCQTTGGFLKTVPPTINVISLKAAGDWTSRIRVLLANLKLTPSLLLPILLPSKPPKTIRYLVDLTNYLRREQPDALL